MRVSVKNLGSKLDAYKAFNKLQTRHATRCATKVNYHLGNLYYVLDFINIRLNIKRIKKIQKDDLSQEKVLKTQRS